MTFSRLTFYHTSGFSDTIFVIPLCISSPNVRFRDMVDTRLNTMINLTIKQVSLLRPPKIERSRSSLPHQIFRHKPSKVQIRLMSVSSFATRVHFLLRLRLNLLCDHPKLLGNKLFSPDLRTSPHGGGFYRFRSSPIYDCLKWIKHEKYHRLE